MKRLAYGLFGLVAACGSGDDTGAPAEDAAGQGDTSTDVSVLPDAGTQDAPFAGDAGDGGSSDALAVSADASLDAAVEADADAGPDPCAEAGVPASTLECAGLYSDFPSKTVSPSAQAYAPAVPLWSDGATKERWIELPSGQTIDATNPNEWTFPVGTKLFKQFTYEGKRVETRMFQKTAANFWVHATYAWNADETATTISYGATVPVDADGGTWVIPTPDDCDSCHRGRSDRILGFEQVSLGLDGATGLTLLQLVVKGLISPAPTQVNLRIGDDGTGVDAPALSWLHINCGVTCHNANENADAYGAGMRLRLDPAWLDGSPASPSWDPYQTTIGVPCVSGSVAGKPRIVPGDPSASVVAQLISERGVLQMPPIASRFVDTTDVASVVSWIRRMGDAGASEPAPEAGPAGGEPEEASAANGVDATLPVDASEQDTGEADGGPEGADEAAASSSADDAGQE
jgi:hypothetical protein